MQRAVGTDLAAEALRAASAGEGWGFEEVFHALAPEVNGYLRAQRARDPEDLTNEVFVRVHERLPRDETADDEVDLTAFRTEVFSGAHALLRDDRGEREPDGADPAISLDAAAYDADVEMLTALEALTLDQRDVLLLRYVAELSLEQVAEVTGRTVTSVKALQRRALDGVVVDDREARTERHEPAPSLLRLRVGRAEVTLCPAGPADHGSDEPKLDRAEGLLPAGRTT
jgi:RNA polymerase sigma factor (sigma-70 family)